MHYAVAHDKILRAVKGTTSQAGEELEDTQYQRVSNSFARRQMSQQQIEELEQLANTSNVVLKTHRRNYQSFVTDAILAEEVNFVETKLSTWMASMEKRANRAQNKKNAQATHTGMECSCCFDEVAVEDMVSCRDEGHLFCVDCLKSFAETQIFGMGNLGIDKETKKRSLELKCFHSDGCASGFGRSGLEKALPKRSLEKYDEVQFILSVEVAGLDDIVSCPNCGYQAALQPSQRVFKCPVIDCLYESCRECGEAAHIPLRCDENKKTDEKETKGRLAVEEAISEAKIRKCPKCSKGVIKSDGCNKISCSCGAHFCYVCRAKILNYTHFCQVALCRHIDCKGCPLYTNGEEDDARAMRKAGLKAANEVRKDDVNIDVENILKAPP
jgi:TRIAD3 protein (E3 ubiquitin-protein ligase RNF216)